MRSTGGRAWDRSPSAWDPVGEERPGGGGESWDWAGNVSRGACVCMFVARSDGCKELEVSVARQSDLGRSEEAGGQASWRRASPGFAWLGITAFFLS